MSFLKTQVGVVAALAMTTVVVGVLAASLLVAYQRVPNYGNLKSVGVGVYWNRSCSVNVTSIDWGFLEPESVVNVTVYVQNEGNTPLVLSMVTENWDPEAASESISLDWNREYYVLEQGSIWATLTLSVAPDVDGISSFSFDIVLIGTESII